MIKARSYFILPLIFIFAILLTLMLEEATLVDARGLPVSVSSSPIANGDHNNDNDDGPPPSNELGEANPGQGGINVPVRDRETPGFSVIFPPGSLQEPVKVKFFSSGLPRNVPLLPGSVSIPDTVVPTSMNSAYFFFAAWPRTSGAEGAVRYFNHSILINAPYEDDNLTPAQEGKIRMWMYNPAAQAWIKLGSKLDIFNNTITGFISSMTPLEENGSGLFAIGLDDQPSLAQSIDPTGRTTLSLLQRKDFRFHVLPGAVEVGTHFEVTSFDRIPDAAFPLLVKPVDIKAYHIKHNRSDFTGDREITEFSKSFIIEFNSIAGYTTDHVTVVMLQDDQWVDLESSGYKIMRDGSTVMVEIDRLGTFSLAIKQ